MRRRERGVERTMDGGGKRGGKFKWLQMHSHLRILRGHLEGGARARGGGGAEAATCLCLRVLVVQDTMGNKRQKTSTCRVTLASGDRNNKDEINL